MFSKKGFVVACLVILTALLISGCFTVPTTVTGVTLNHEAMTLTAGGATGTLVATVAPATATNKSVTWSSSSEVVATVANGIVTPLTAGTTTITVTTVDGDFTAECAITVTLTPVTITIAAIPGVTAPITGATPDTTVTTTAQYTGTVTWSGSPTTFAASKVYTATITLTAKTGYTLSGVAANFFTVADATSDTNSANSGVVTAKFPATAATITTKAIPGVTAPVTGATPDTTVTATTQYTGTVTWSPTATTFAAGTVYTATITLRAKTGYTLSGVAANFFTVAGATSDTNPADSGIVTAKFPATAAVVVTLSTIPGVTAPLTGATPDTTITATSQYTGTITWLPAHNPFQAATAYTATITLTAKAGYTLSGVAANFFTVAGATSDTNPADSGIVTAKFPATAAVAAEINIAAIPGVTAPLTGAAPDTTVTATSQYTGTVTWLPAHNPFQAATAYTATITLTAKAGYTLSGVAANFFTVAGATSDTNSANSGVVTAVFPATAAAAEVVINIAAILGVTAPVTGAVPVTEITETAQYSGWVTWFPPFFWPGETFAGARVYTAEIMLWGKTGYTFEGVAADFFTVDGAVCVNNANSGFVTAEFPATEAAIIDLAAIPGVTAPITGAAPVTEISATDQYTGTVTWSPADATFAAGTEYTAWITLIPETGYTLTGVAANFFTVAGATSDTNSANSGDVTAVFPVTVAPVEITISGIIGVTVPVAGAAPVTEITATAQYTGTVAWSTDPTTFAAGTVYTATITITPEAGWTLTGVDANFFTVAGTTSDTNSANSGDVTAAFPATAATITIPGILGVTAPVTGAAPVTEITATAQYTGTVTWSPADAIFVTGTEYTAWITLMPEAGWTLTDVAANFFTVAEAVSDTNSANSGDVTAVFPVTTP